MPDKFQENSSKANTPFGVSRPCGIQARVSPKIKFYYANPLQGAVFVCWPSQNSKCIYPHLVGWTLRAPCWGEPHTKYNFTNQTYPEEQILFAGLLSILNAYTPFCWVGPCGPQVWVSPPQIKFYCANPPRGANFVCWPPLNSQCIYPLLVGWTLWAWG